MPSSKQKPNTLRDEGYHEDAVQADAQIQDEILVDNREAVPDEANDYRRACYVRNLRRQVLIAAA